MNEKIISALVGLAGASGSNGKTPNTDLIVMNALISCYSEDAENTVADAIINEKYIISPNCRTCPSPCGNTSDYDMEKFHKNKELKALKEELIKEAAAFAVRLRDSGAKELPDDIYRAIAYFGYELSADSYKDLIGKLRQMEV